MEALGFIKYAGTERYDQEITAILNFFKKYLMTYQ